MFLLRLGIKNLFRNLRRTVLSMGAVIAGVGVLILGQGFIQGVTENIIRTQVDSVSGHVMVRPLAYPTVGLQHPVDELFEVTPELRAFLDENTLAWTGRTLFVPRAIAGIDAIRVRGIAIDVATDEGVFSRHSWKTTGDVPQSAVDGVAVGKGIVSLLGVGVGDRLVLQARTAAGALNALDVPISGILAVGNPMIDSVGVVFPGDLANELIGNGDSVSHLAIRLTSRDRAEAFAVELQSHIPANTEVVTWVDETRDMMSIQQIRQRALNMLVFALLGMSAAGIANTILMAAYERVREIGTLRAMGMTRGAVIQMFVIEGALIGLIGASLGALLGGGVVAYYANVGIDLSGFVERSGMDNIPFSTMLYLRYSHTLVFGAMVFGVVVAIVASVYPARVASRMNPADAMREG